MKTKLVLVRAISQKQCEIAVAVDGEQKYEGNTATREVI